MDRPLLDLFARADALPRLPRLGGMARPNGVVIVGERFWAFAGIDGSLREGEMPSAPKALRRVPLVRGLLRLGSAISPIVRRDGVVRTGERWLLIAVLLAPLALFLLPSLLQTVVGVLLSVVMLAWLLRGRTLRLHGAEHRAIAAVEQRTPRLDVVGHHAALAVRRSLRHELRRARASGRRRLRPHRLVAAGCRRAQFSRCR